MNRLYPSLLAAWALTAPIVARADAPTHWTALCASCHGKDGAGHTRAGKLVGTKDLTNAAYQKTFTDDQAFADLKNGLDKDGKTKMKPFADKLTDADIRELVAYVRGLPH